jgi:hypothetical protein
MYVLWSQRVSKSAEFADMPIHEVTGCIVFMNSPDLIHIYNTVDSFWMTASTKDATTSDRFTCQVCGKLFDSLGDMQRHATVEHIQKGEVPSGSKQRG